MYIFLTISPNYTKYLTVAVNICHKPHFIYAKTKHNDSKLKAFKQALSSYSYACCSVFQRTGPDQQNSDNSVFKKAFKEGKLSCSSL